MSITIRTLKNGVEQTITGKVISVKSDYDLEEGDDPEDFEEIEGCILTLEDKGRFKKIYITDTPPIEAKTLLLDKQIKVLQTYTNHWYGIKSSHIRLQDVQILNEGSK
jgi:hypothetical protein